MVLCSGDKGESLKGLKTLFTSMCEAPIIGVLNCNLSLNPFPALLWLSGPWRGLVPREARWEHTHNGTHGSNATDCLEIPG